MERSGAPGLWPGRGVDAGAMLEEEFDHPLPVWLDRVEIAQPAGNVERGQALAIASVWVSPLCLQQDLRRRQASVPCGNMERSGPIYLLSRIQRSAHLDQAHHKLERIGPGSRQEEEPGVAGRTGPVV